MRKDDEVMATLEKKNLTPKENLEMLKNAVEFAKEVNNADFSKKGLKSPETKAIIKKAADGSYLKNEKPVPVDTLEQHNGLKNLEDLRMLKTAVDTAKVLKDEGLVPVESLTVSQVGQKLKNSFKRIKGIWDERNREIRKNEKKMEKLNEQMFELKEDRENLENELEGIRQTYADFCKQTGIAYELN